MFTLTLNTMRTGGAAKTHIQQLEEDMRQSHSFRDHDH